MAVPWIKIETTLLHKPEVMRLAALLDCDEYKVTGHLVAFWSWVDANLSRTCPEFQGTKSGLDRVAGCAGFVDAMLQVGWLSLSGSVFTIPHFEYHLSQSAKTRGEDARKKAKSRAAKDKAGTNVPENQGQKADIVGTNPGLEERRGEERKEKKAPRAESRVTEPQTLPSDFPEHPSEVLIPPKVDTPDCRKAMADWQRHLDVSAAPNAIVPGSPQEQALWQWAARMGPEKWIQSVEYTIAQGGFRLLEKWDTPHFSKSGSKPKPSDASTDPVWLNVLQIHQRTDDSPTGRADRNERLTPAEREAGMQVQMRTRLPNVANDWDRKQLAAEFMAALKMIQDREAARAEEYERAF